MQKKMRMTKQKKIILDILQNTKCHPTADWIYQEARKILPEISLGTVYRNLRILKEQGKILELNYGSTFSRYDGNSSNHYHFVCQKCGKVFDVDMDRIDYIENEVNKKLDAVVINHRLEFYGICKDCKK
jgi:Fur family ferric uptake transcriptional regulator/Fur family peroxide stress response transcriptional regulator